MTSAVTRAVREYPIRVALTLLLVALLFRLNDIFVLRLDERLGEIILSKSLGFVLIVIFLWIVGRSLSDIGLRRRALGPSVLVAVVLTVIALLTGYAIELLLLWQGGAQPTLQLTPIDPKAGVAVGSGLFALWLVLGNFVNSFMEEGLFRGLMGRLFLQRLTFWQANWLQALLFGAWHLPWVLKWYQTGTIQTPGEITVGVISNFFPQVMLGLFWGYLYFKTGNLWAPWISHTITNSTLNLLHVATATGLNEALPLRMTAYTIMALLGMFLIKYVADRLGLPETRPWGSAEGRSNVR